MKSDIVYSPLNMKSDSAVTNLHNSLSNKGIICKAINSIVLIAALSLMTLGCFEEKFVSNVSIPIEVSLDTVRFDTVFTTVGSATRSLVIYNRTDENVNISSIALANGESSMFRLNVDGIPGPESLEVPVLARDSLHVFIEVTVDPDQPLSVSPFIISEDLLIRAGENQRIVKLEAWGQNANYFPSRDSQGRLISLSCQSNQITWDDQKPYVIYGLLFIDSCELVLPAGTQVFVHGGLARIEETIFNDGGLIFLPDGKLTTRGTADKPVVFQGDRLESGFDDVPGQWSGIRFFDNSTGHSLEFTEIRNSIVGIRADSASSARLENVIISNTTNIGLIGVHASLEVENSLIHSNGPQSVALAYGGNYTFTYTSIANFENQSPALYMDNFNCLDAECSTVLVNALNATFINSIIMGSNDDEIDLNDATNGMEPDFFNLTFENSLIKIDEVRNELDPMACMDCLEHNGEPVFLNELEDDYTLDTMSVARDQGIPIPGLSIDLIGNIRDMNTPDIGCYEFLD